MLDRSIEDDMYYYRSKILKLIIDNPKGYGIREIEYMFGLSRDKIEGFILEYNKMGFEVSIKKGRYFIRKSSEYLEAFLVRTKELESELYTIAKNLKNESICDKKVSTEKFKKNLNNSLSISLKNALNILERDGLVFFKNGYINILEPPFEALNNDKILKLLIFINVVRNLYPKRNLLNSIFKKLLLEYENRGFKFDTEAIQYINKHRANLYEELVLNVVEEAIYCDKSLEFSYRTQVGIRNIKINPSGIIYNSQKDIWYVVSIGERNTEYRMDKMTNVKIVEGSSVPFSKSLYEYSMGVSGESLIDVKAAFKREDYIYKKLLNYIKLRKSAGIRETNNAYILTDRVCGTNEFKKWIRAFGKDAACLKPDTLREELFKDVKLLKERYEVI